METIAAALIAAAASVAVTLITVSIQNSKSQAVTNTKIDNLTAEVEKHNSVVERMFHLEAKVEEQNKTLFARYNEVHEATQDIAVTARHAQERADAAHNRLDRAGIQGGIS